eukprot:GILI01005069.1.p1 GENE.GILI01005069.1~~GILI01005069.1.p1  ORF type:complete len:360 (+),score=84.33 GILI01005069.1:127-1080(+)
MDLLQVDSASSNLAPSPSTSALLVGIVQHVVQDVVDTAQTDDAPLPIVPPEAKQLDSEFRSHMEAVVAEQVPAEPSSSASSSSSSSAVSPSSLPARAVDGMYYISQTWYNRFLTLVHPGPITNEELLCEHGRPREDSSGKVVAVSEETWNALVAKFGGGPVVQDTNTCERCKQEAAYLEERRTLEKQMIVKYDNSTTEPGKYWYIIDAEWLKKWRCFVHRQGSSKNSIKGPPPPPPINNRCLLDDQGLPRPNLKRVVHYRGINVLVWKVFLRFYGGGPLVMRNNLELYEEDVTSEEGLDIEPEDQLVIQRCLSSAPR